MKNIVLFLSTFFTCIAGYSQELAYSGGMPGPNNYQEQSTKRDFQQTAWVPDNRRHAPGYYTGIWMMVGGGTACIVSGLILFSASGQAQQTNTSPLTPYQETLLNVTFVAGAGVYFAGNIVFRVNRRREGRGRWFGIAARPDKVSLAYNF